MYTIKQAAMRSGVGSPLIRAWERRYGIVAPSRTDAGYRLYDDGMVATLRAMRALIAAGWGASQAASAILAGEIAMETWAPRGIPRSADGTSPAAALVSADRRDPITAFVVGCQAYDVNNVETALDEMFSRGSFEAVVDDLVLPAAVALGDAWADGRLDVGAEHLGSAAIFRRLAGAFDAAAQVVSGPRILIGLPPGARHELGALAFAVTLRRRGLHVVYLGADVPLTSWVVAAADTGAAAAAIGVVSPADVSSADETRIALIAANPWLVIAFGGKAASTLQLDQTDGRQILLPDRVTDARDVLGRTIDPMTAPPESGTNRPR